MTEEIDLPAFIIDDYLEYLNKLHESSETNMQKKTKESDVICPECGATFPEQRCSECGHPLVILEQRDPITAAKAEADLKREIGE